MPKQFGQTSWAILVVLATLSLVGCRTAATKLANVPGMGWMEPEAEGWAGYEPAPGIPTPSSTAEPTSPGGDASKLAAKPSNSTDKLSEKLADSGKDKKLRFDPKYLGTDKRSDKSSDKESGYATAYGQFGPPTAKNAEDAVQRGPYEAVAAAAKPSDDATSKYEGKDTPYFRASNRFASNDTSGSGSFGASTKIPAKYDPLASATNTPDSNSGGSRFSANSNAPNWQGGPKAPATQGRFGDVSGATDAIAQAKDEIQRYSMAARDQLKDQAGQAAQQAEGVFNKYADLARQSMDQQAANAQTAVADAGNRFAQAGQEAASRFLNAGKQEVAAAAQQLDASVANGVQQAADQVNRYAAHAQNTGNQYMQQAQQQLGQLTGQPANAANQLTNGATQAANTLANNAQQAQQQMNRFADQSFSQSGQALQAAKDQLAARAQSAYGQAQAQASRFGNDVQAATQQFGQQATGAAQQFAQGVKQDLQQTASDAYANAQSAASNMATNTANNLQAQAQGLANRVANSPQVQQTVQATQGYLNTASQMANQTREAISGYAAAPTTPQGVGNAASAPAAPAHQGAGHNVMQNVSTATPSAYPRTNTPNPFVIPGRQSPASTINPQQGSGPATIRRSDQPFRPGSTTNLQSHQVRKQEVRLASAESEIEPTRQPLVLAVGDTQQFPRMMR